MADSESVHSISVSPLSAFSMMDPEKVVVNDSSQTAPRSYLPESMYRTVRTESAAAVGAAPPILYAIKRFETHVRHLLTCNRAGSLMDQTLLGCIP